MGGLRLRQNRIEATNLVIAVFVFLVVKNQQRIEANSSIDIWALWLLLTSPDVSNQLLSLSIRLMNSMLTGAHHIQLNRSSSHGRVGLITGFDCFCFLAAFIFPQENQWIKNERYQECGLFLGRQLEQIISETFLISSRSSQR